MKTRWLIGAALAMQVAMVSVAASAPDPSQYGGGIKDAFICAGCIAGGIVAVASGGAELAAITIAVGGPAAVALGALVAECVYSCYQALS